MNCPICGAKLKNDKCPYCKITNKQVIYASNKDAKELRLKKQDTSNIHYSNVLPKDVNKVKLWIFLLLGGWFGADSFLTGKYVKGMFCLFTYAACYISSFLKTMAQRFNWGANAVYTFGILLSVSAILGVVVFMMWFVGVIAMLSKKYKVPVVMPSAEVADEMHFIAVKEEKERAKEQKEKDKKE